MLYQDHPTFEPSFLERQHFEYINVCGCRGSGKTSFLRALQSHFGWGHATLKDVPGDKRDGTHNESDEYSRDWHPIIWLDFSDYNAASFSDALIYIAQKMSELYTDALLSSERNNWYFDAYEEYLNIIEGTCEQSALARSLLDMVFLQRRCTRHGQRIGRPIILIDEVSRPLLYAAEFGFLHEMQSFMDSFLDIDHYELDAGIITTSFCPANVDVNLHLKFLGNEPINCIEPLAQFCKDRGIELSTDTHRRMTWSTRRYFDECIDLKECFAKLKEAYDDAPAPAGSITDHTDAREDEVLGILLPPQQIITASTPDARAAPSAMHCTSRIALSDEVRAFVQEGRNWVQRKRELAKQAELKFKERERREYAAPLPDSCHIPSRFAGVRELRMDVSDAAAHDSLNDLLKDLYARKGPKPTQRDAYDFIQGFDGRSKRLSNIDNTLYELKELALARDGVQRCTADTGDSYWGRFDFERDYDRKCHGQNYGDLSLVKAYLSARNHTHSVALFRDVVSFLVQTCSRRFHAKVSRYKRSDQICLWIPREDFFALERHIATFDEEVVTPLPFVAYRNKLGVSREFCTWDSHNGAQATLISCYLQQIKDEAEIDAIDMYSLYVRAWNGELDESHPFTKEFKRSDAQELLVLLETLDVILGNATLTDDCLLLSNDGSLWGDLGCAKNWHAVGAARERTATRRARTANQPGVGVSLQVCP